jgi:hypothetical protein
MLIEQQLHENQLLNLYFPYQIIEDRLFYCGRQGEIKENKKNNFFIGGFCSAII